MASSGREGMQTYYEQGLEQDRLSEAKGALEFERTTEILQRRLPEAPARSPTSAAVPVATRSG